MKKIKLLILGFLLSTVLVCGGCSNDNSIQNTANGEQADTQNKPSEEENKDEKDKQQEVDKKEENASKTEEVIVTVYYPNENADGLDREEVKCQKLTSENIWDLLKLKEVVDEDTEVNHMDKEENTLKLDLNTAFGEQLRSYGTAGETMLMQSVVNTFLDAYDCEQIQITENGGVLVSGHREYADMIHKYE